MCIQAGGCSSSAACLVVANFLLDTIGISAKVLPNGDNTMDDILTVICWLLIAACAFVIAQVCRQMWKDIHG